MVATCLSPLPLPLSRPVRFKMLLYSDSIVAYLAFQQLDFVIHTLKSSSVLIFTHGPVWTSLYRNCWWQFVWRYPQTGTMRSMYYWCSLNSFLFFNEEEEEEEEEEGADEQLLLSLVRVCVCVDTRRQSGSKEKAEIVVVCGRLSPSQSVSVSRQRKRPTAHPLLLDHFRILLLVVASPLRAVSFYNGTLFSFFCNQIGHKNMPLFW